MIIIFWISIFLIVYTFVGYGFVLYILVRIKGIFKKPYIFKTEAALPSVTVLIAAYNEEDIIEDKIENTLQLNYPKDKVQAIFITDGSSDSTADKVRGFDDITLLHQDIRAGKMAAIKRAIPYIKGEITVFTDANTFLNKEALLELVKHYQNPKVGAVAGEKRILVEETADASSAGEGFYWKYESKLKKWDYELYSNVGAAGELFSIRTNLYQPVESDTIIDDHMIAMRIAENGFIIAYEPGAYAMETASADVKEELKRKIRIAAGGIQSIMRLKKAANPFNNPVFTFQYISHRVLRWTITPFLLFLVFILNVIIALDTQNAFYQIFLVLQVLFYLLSLTGLYFESRNIRVKALFIPYYFCVMNYAVLAGIIRYYKKNQSAAWEKSKRKI
ncbi:Glycosyltransferase, catalytic subunit of cellulose synthase and poly-beta-1,6-N-acetylglucosamine synthase [Pedobacter westerhofensis]|uniref:Glycosyltransferase, catalytic subunit of cellulose synthase and poly-beta-1,6-N-acetylglucosamine synthase n=1 Tax=Pedobacter westerhofensis TaxID=425512 RepID=A0A521E718_9SPHI|nr:glycosyltransferase family 2 protein [Pedobacter westerhofensis]SMO79687.1 Glycosyltransferase, catalytic subunit of cellulose synthase and poly-beta-1,6-N-acetylglucosamine synthase [Pedobacter westerhofensis]